MRITTQQELRDALLEAMADKLDDLDMPALGDVVMNITLTDESLAIDKASHEVYASLITSLKRVSRLAVRLGYLQKETI